MRRTRQGVTASTPTVRVGVCAALLLWGVQPLRADELVVEGKTLHRAQVIGYSDGDIEIRTSSGETDRFPLTDVEFILLDSVTGVADFNQAEELMVKRQAAQAIERYERAVRAARGFWASMARVRLLMAADAAGDLERAVRVWLDVAAEDARTAADLLPHTEAGERDPASRRTQKRLEKALEEASGSETRALILLVYYDFLQRTSDASAPTVAADVTRLNLPASLMTARTLAIQLAAFEAEAGAQHGDAVLTALETLIATAPEAHLPEVLLMKSRLLLATAKDTRGFMLAALPAMRVAIHFAGSPAAGEGLLLAAEAHQRCGRATDEELLLRECLRLKETPERVREAARARLAELASEPE